MAESSLETKPSKSLRKRLTERGPMVLYGILFSACLAVGVGFQFQQWSSQVPLSTPLFLLYSAITTVGFGSLWLFIRRYYRLRQDSPAKTLWSLLITGFILISVAAITSRIGRIDAPGLDLGLGFDLNTGIALTFPTIVKMVVISVLLVSFAFLLLNRFQGLVLVKRSKTSQRNWNVMLFSMTLTAALTLMNSPGAGQNQWQNMALAVSVVFMVVNSFRLSWIVFLSFKEKLAMIGLCLVFAAFLILAFGFSPLSSDMFVIGGSEFLQHFFVPLATFVEQASLFGILYCSTAFLSLLFHLPTSGDYEQRAGERATMHSLAHLVGQMFDAETLYATIAAAPVEAGSADASWLVMPDPSSGSLRHHVVSSHNISPDRISELVDSALLVDEMTAQGNPLIIREAPADHRLNVRPGDEIGSLLVVPLIARDELIGALFASKAVVSGFERDDVETISIFAAQASVAIDNARLFEQQVEKERLSRELSIAREVQRKLLPQSVPELPGLSMAASSISAQEVGGDYYDFVQLENDRYGVIIGDVSGKGTSAAFYMAEMRGIFQSVSRLAATPSIFLHHANMALAQTLDRNVFISVIYLIIDLKNETLDIARAGHCPAATVRLSGESRFLRTKGLGLGLDRGDLFLKSLEEERINLEPGDVFVLYTDGVVESRNPEGEEFGYDRLLVTIDENRHEDADGIHSAVLSDLKNFMGNEVYDDDMTLVVLKWHGLPLEALSLPIQSMEESK